MNEKEKLITIIQNAVGGCARNWADVIATALIESNEVIIPPCKIGDKVYVIEPCTCYNNYRTPDECHHRRTKATKFLRHITLPTKHHTKCLKLYARPFKLEYLNKINKTVFLTKEEAEQALKER